MLPRSCVCVLTVGLPDPSRQTARPDAGDGWSGGIVLASGQNRPERNPAERPGRDVLARRANRDAGCDAAVRPHGRMRDGPKGRSPLRHAKPSRGGRKASPRLMCRDYAFDCTDYLSKHSMRWAGIGPAVLPLQHFVRSDVHLDKRECRDLCNLAAPNISIATGFAVSSGGSRSLCGCRNGYQLRAAA